MARGTVELAPGLVLHQGRLDRAACETLGAEIAAVLEAAPPYRPRMPRSGRPLSVLMSNCGTLGWLSEPAGYRYGPAHPETGAPWPPIPALALGVWAALSGHPAPPEAGLVNLYAPDARMGLHQDRDEAEFAAPVVSLSLGATALFRYGGLRRGDPTRSVRLAAGDVLVMGGPARLIHHGIDRLIASEPDLLAGTDGDALPAGLRRFLPEGGRCNLTLRRVNPAA